MKIMFLSKDEAKIKVDMPDDLWHGRKSGPAHSSHHCVMQHSKPFGKRSIG